MALPLKSGADLYNQQAIRMRLHNLGADPIEVGMGLIYFNTNTDTNGSNHALHACVHDGTQFKALAYVDDVANNEEFLAVKRKVDAFFDGGVDADNVLENLAEVQKFLDNYSGATSLSQILDTKLDKSGGTINGELTIKPTYYNGLNIDSPDPNLNQLTLSVNGALKAIYQYNANYGVGFAYEGNGGIYVGNDGVPLFVDSASAKYPLLTSAGGTMDTKKYLRFRSEGAKVGGGGWAIPFLRVSNRDATTDYASIAAYGGDDAFVYLYLGTQSYDGLNLRIGYNYLSWGDNPILHSGNVGDYALKTDGSNAITGSLNFRTDTALYRFANDSSGGASWYNGSDWKTIAFTDSTVAAANKLVTSGGAAFAEFTESTVYIGSETNNNHNTFIMGKNVRLYYGNTAGFTLNSSGNVTIGSQDLAGTSAKLYVDGRASICGNLSILNTSDTDILATLQVNTTGLQIQARKENVGYLNTVLNYEGGNVLIGTTTDNGTKLQVAGSSYFSKTAEFKNAIFANRYSDSVGASIVINKGGDYFGIGASASNSMNLALGLTSDLNGTWKEEKIVIGSDSTTINGDLRVTGNIIAEKQVSAKGKAKEAPASGGGAGLFYATTIGEGTTSTSIAHNLGTENVIICIYEKSTISGEVVWNQILTDVEIKGINSVQVTFGNATDVEHKVVIMGAAA